MSNTELVEGIGTCDPKFRLKFTPAPEALQMGAGPDIYRGIFAAVHHANRRSTKDNLAAIVLPGARLTGEVAKGEQGFGDLGNSVVVFGSEDLLKRIKSDTRLAKHLGNGALKTRLREVDAEEGEEGVALTRIRSWEKKTEGWHQRNEARRARRAEHIAKTANTQEGYAKPARRDFFVQMGRASLDLAVHRGVYRGGTVEVNTYGLSRNGTPAFLPEFPDVGA
ncbi:MAG: type I-F CRISPR-associated endoribonuclease Cas6/Csy4 [Paracoccus sp. (in: a-proteobacteria)]|uniref:type I-F CRISPR-associated endoribonuclease Cas6/Csy4 n=1 Tax=Paracoccus sp. TaxID=267 RepID=UPI003002F13D